MLSLRGRHAPGNARGPTQLGQWGRLGAVLGGSVALILFASPLPGVPTLVWGATFYLTGIPVVLIAEAVPTYVIDRLPLPSFTALLHFWPVVVTTVLATVFILVGGVAGQLAVLSCGRKLQNNQMQLTAPGRMERRS